jgi:outer membrane protein insertion porin family
MRKSALVLCFALISNLFLHAQNSQEWYNGKPIKDIVFKGLNTVSLNEVKGIVTPYFGKKFTDEVFWNLQSSLYALDYFETIIPNAVPGDPDRNSVIIEFTVEERPVVGEILFRGNKKVRTGDLLDVVLIKTGDMINTSKVRIDEEAVRVLYLERGFPDVTVSSAIETDTKNKKKNIIFEITEGSQTSLRSLRFSGNTAYTESTLKKVTESKEQSLFNSGTFQERKFEQDLRLIERYYRERGYIDAKVQEVTREVERDEAENRTFLNITVYLKEGDQYQYGGMEFQGNRLFSTERLNALLRQKAGGLLNMTRVDADFQRVADLYYENGYIFNTINREEKRDETTKTVSFTIKITERNRAHIENILIKGNRKTKDFVLFRELPLEVGDVFSKAKIVEGLQNLYNLQYFSAVTPETPPGSVDGLMDLIINVEESSTADIMFGLAFGGSSEFPVSGNIRWTDRNFLGQGQTFSVELNASPIYQTLSFNFLEKWLFGKRWSGGFDFTIRHSTTSGIPQDILAPVFDGNDPGNNAFPDPFTGEYVYRDSGKPFGRKPTSAEISDLGLVTDYQYAGGTTAIVPSQYKMTYETYDFSIGFNTGYRFRTPLGTLGTGTGLRTTLTYLDYEPDLFRPYLSTDRLNRGSWLFSNSLALSLSLDKRDFYFNPSRGYYFSQTGRFVGGILQGEKHYIKTESKVENFYTLLDVNMSETWRYRLILGLHSALSFIWPQFWVPKSYDRLTAGTADLLWVDGMYIARGWTRELDKRAIWDNWIELRMPLSEQLIWFDIFFDMVGRWDAPSDFTGFRKQDFLFGYGAGFRFTIPQFPIRIYMAKRFKYNEFGDIEMQSGPLFRDTLGMDFVFSIGYEIFNQ